MRRQIALSVSDTRKPCAHGEYFSRNYTVSQKVVHQTHGDNFVNFQRIFKILLLLEKEVNFQQNLCNSGAVVQLVEYRTRNRDVKGSTHTRSTASNLEQVANLLCAQANSASYPQWDENWVVATATGWRPTVTDWGDGVSASCTVGSIVR